MSPRHPLLLDVTGRLVVVVGGGPVAARRVRSLLTDGGAVRVVAPALCEDLADLAAAGAVTWLAREYAPGDLDGAWLVHTATGDPRTDATVSADAQAARTWCVRADDAASSTAWTPAVARAGDVTVAVSAGGDPRRALALRAALQTLLDTGALPVRRHRAGAGHVALVGGGPGDPGLITTRGRRALAEADVVVVDRLAPRALLDELEPGVEVVEAGKAPHAHTLTQDEINRLLVERARAGQRVVRLKGGDPFVLGRGGEELAACLAAGVDVEVVPGVTSAIAVPGAAGVPVTHRDLARQVTVVSAHDADTDWETLARLRGTLVLLMGVGRLGEHMDRLVGHGLAATTPVAVVEDGTLPTQRTTLGTAATIADRAREVGVRNPAVVVVGDVAALAATLGRS
ncbi:MAG: uroporphyrinogen-III C-methyltransferase [Cellulomonas iranensis]|uniref:uroporphyrinogen-III C-methyltransferase n=1 Tax=Cellulomonas TaxID=1707 RepID=UPI001070AA72|nr:MULTISPECIES: uroporphyrinogen-III C-methyltransferase [Cellulomonas]MBO9567224.1 uroporphyrinogen-III C-methyltransferase [Cellulomonas iranensis]TFH69627.1 uroporphyrinogen-III C-methyltransferase [Cellulomonas sp. HD19AZ1]UCN13194.1 uroporphyrinogen-III C-methyltransferase [Cellulomonas iranensis]